MAQTDSTHTPSSTITFTYVPADQTVSCVDEAIFGTPTASTSCAGGVQISFSDSDDHSDDHSYDGDNEYDNCSYTITRTWTATNNCGRSASVSSSITVNDNTNPVFTFVPANLGVTCSNLVVFGTPTATDNCGVVTITYDDEVDHSNDRMRDHDEDGYDGGDDDGDGDSDDDDYNYSSCNYTITRIWTATDRCGNKVNASQTIVVNDNVAPEFSFVPANIIATCTDNYQFGEPVVADNCTSVVLSHVDTFEIRSEDHSDGDDDDDNSNPTPDPINIEIPIDYTQCDATYTRTWTAVDACGNISTATQSITVRDDVAPVMSGMGADATIVCPETPVFTAPTATDACDISPDVVVVSDVTTPACAGTYSQTITWKAVDACGNESEPMSQTITVIDNVAPVFSFVPADGAVNCAEEVQFGEPVAADNCSDVVLTFEDMQESGDTRDRDDNDNENENNEQSDCAYTVTRTWTATDACGNYSTASQSILVDDVVAPAFSFVPADYSVTCSTLAIFGTPTATDNCGEVEISYENESEHGEDRARDNDSNDDGQDDNENDGEDHDGDGDHDDDDYNYEHCNYTISRTWTATDACGNKTTATQTIRVNDNVAPVFDNIPADYTVACTDDVVFGNPTATDNCSNVTISNGNDEEDHSDDNGYDRTPRANNNVAICHRTGNGGHHTIYVSQNAVAAHLAHGDYLGECEEEEDGEEFDNCNYTASRSWTATDACGNSTTITQTITVIDNVAPVISAAGEDATISCPAVPEFTAPSATDNCDSRPAVVVVSDVTTPACGGTYTRTITWKAVDACENESNTVSQTITVIDTDAPAFTFVAADSVVNCVEEVYFQEPSATDACSNVVITYTEEHVSGDARNHEPTDVIEVTDCAFTIVRTWTATDECGNYTTAVQSILVDDVIAPEFTFVPNDTLVHCNLEAAGAFGEPVAIDNCGELTVTFEDFTSHADDRARDYDIHDGEDHDGDGDHDDDDQHYENCVYSITRTWTATDECGNKVSASQTVQVNDNIAPVFTFVPANYTVACRNDIAFGTPAAVDNCSAVRIEYRHHSDHSADATRSNSTPCNQDMDGDGDYDGDDDNYEGCNYTVSRTWTATDACGNETSVTQTITVNDNVAPQIVDVADRVLTGCNPSWPSLSSTWTDNCSTGGVVAGVAGNIVEVNATTQSRVYTFTVTDRCGNPDVETTLVTRTFDATTAATSISSSANSIVTGGSVTLSVVGGNLGNGATWNWFSGTCGGTFIGTGASIVVSPTANTTYFVRAQGSCVTTGCRSKAITVTQPCGATSVSSNATGNTVCSGSNVTLSVVGSTGTGGNWKWYRSSCGGTLVGTGASITVAPTANTTYFVRSEGGTCGVTSCMSIAISVTTAPAQPGTISGTATGVCGQSGRVYSVAAVSGATSYSWTAPSGATIVSGQGTNSITVNFTTAVANNATISVKAVNNCGMSAARNVTLTTAPTASTSISGVSTIMTTQTTTYSVNAVAGATNYAWTVPSGWSITSGQGTSTINVVVGNTTGTVTLKVTPSNSCGSGSQVLKSITVNQLRSAVYEEEVVEENNTISIYPNPAKDVLYLNTGSISPAQVEIFDVLGNLVYNGTTTSVISLDNLTNGMYFVRIQVDGQIETKRLQVVK